MLIANKIKYWSNIYNLICIFEISSEELTIALTRRIRDKPITGDRRFRWCNYDGRDPDICKVLAGLRPTDTVGPKKNFQFVKKFEKHLRVTIFYVTRIIRVLCDRENVDPQVTAQSVRQSFQHQMLRFTHGQPPHAFEAYMKIVHKVRYILIVLGIDDIHLAERKSLESFLCIPSSRALTLH